MPKLTLEQAIERVQTYFDNRCMAKYNTRAIVEVKEAVENPHVGVFIIRCEERCLAEFSKRRKELAVDSQTGEIKALKEWE